MQADWAAPSRLDVHLTIAEGFHLNAHDAPSPLIPTTLSIAPPHVDRIRSIDYPPGEEQSFSFQDRPLRVYAGQITLSIHFNAPLDPGGQPVKLLLHYQPCTRDACLQPATLRLTIAGA